MLSYGTYRQRRTSYISLFISYIHTRLCFGAQHLFYLGAVSFVLQKNHRSQGCAVIQSHPVPAHDRQNMNGTIDIHEFVMFFRTRRGCEKWCCEFVRLPLSLGRWLLVAGVRPDAFGFHLGPNGGNLGLSIILFIRLIISLALWACLHSNPGDF